MSHTAGTTGDQLTGALHALGIKFLMGGDPKEASLHKQPEFSVHVRAAARGVRPSARLTLQCYYSAAVWLRRKYQPRKRSLPDYFGVLGPSPFH